MSRTDTSLLRNLRNQGFPSILVMGVAVFVLVGSLVAFLSAGTVEEKLEVARSFYGAPGAQWEILEQPFWKRHVVFRLAATGDPRWPHRPSVAVDVEDKGHLLTDGVVRLPRERMLASFNRIAQREAVQITANNVEKYAIFFVRVHLLSNDFLYIADKIVAERIPSVPRESSEIKALRREFESGREGRLGLTMVDSKFGIRAFLWNSQGGWVAEHNFTIERDGTVDYGGAGF